MTGRNPSWKRKELFAAGGRAAARLALCVLVGAAAFAQKEGEVEKLAPFYPTPETVVERMLKLGGLKAGEKMFDLGSGDGRIVIMAAQKFHADATGIEIDKDLHKQSMDKIRGLNLQKTARIVNGDILRQDYSSADLVSVYLLPMSNDKIRPMLEKQLKKGTRIVSHDFEFSGWTAEKVESIDDDGEGRSHTLYLYRRP
ncbi:MAG: class I SAM-dependent methyltransferase [Bryobacteraceae bacterium]